MNTFGKLLLGGTIALTVLLSSGCVVVGGHVSYGYYGGYYRPYYGGPGYIGRPPRPPAHRPPGHRPPNRPPGNRPPGNRPPKPVHLPARPTGGGRPSRAR